MLGIDRAQAMKSVLYDLWAEFEKRVEFESKKVRHELVGRNLGVREREEGATDASCSFLVLSFQNTTDVIE